MIVFAVVDVISGRDEEVWTSMAKRLKGLKGDVTPLIMNRIFEQEDIALTLRVTDPKMLPTFLVENVRSIEGVRDIETFSLFEGTFLAEKDRVQRDAEGLHAYAFIATEPGQDREVYDTLCSLGEHMSVYPRFVAFTFHKMKCTIILSLNAPSIETLEEFLIEKVRCIDGVTDTQTMIGTRYQFLVEPSDVYKGRTT